MKIAVVVYYMDEDMDPSDSCFEIEDVEEQEFSTLQAAKDFAWQKLEEGYVIRMWRRG